MILHCTQKLVARIPYTADPSEVVAGRDVQAGPLSSWHGHLLTLDRRQCVLFCHDSTRYVLFLPGLRAPQLAELGQWHRTLFLAVLEAQGLTRERIARAGLMLGQLKVHRSTDRSVLSSMRVAADDLKYGMLNRTANVMDLDPIVTSLALNERPCRANGALVWPKQAMHELVERLESFDLLSTSKVPHLSS